MSQRSSSLLRPDAGWFLNLYPGAGEGGGSFVSSRRTPRAWVAPGEAADPDRARTEAGRRARGKVRRYCSENRLNRLGTLTYRGEGCHDQAQLRADVAAFFLALRCELRGKAFPYVWVPEWHKSDHGMHVHFAVGQFIARGMIERAWGRGYVHIKRLSDLPVGSTSLHESRRAAGYLSKYVSKSFESGPRERLAGLHRYEVAQGFQPRAMRITGRCADELLTKADAVMGSSPSQSWSSRKVEGWQGPPAVWFAWG